MLPRTHRRAIRRALACAGAPRLRRLEAAIKAGSDDEDRYRWPIVGWTTPALGLTHSTRPGRSRGELGFPSARARILSELARARAGFAHDPEQAARRLGRACHLLVDAAVPARAQGVWHYLGDPLERWIDDHLGELDALELPLPGERDPRALADRLAERAARMPADRTRSFSGRALAALGLRAPIGEGELAAQGRILWPLAVAHLAALLAGFDAAAP